MKFLMAILANVVIGLILGWGILQAAQGRVGLLLVGLLAYVVAFIRLGCLPSKSH
jgi:hypothetical protein